MSVVIGSVAGILGQPNVVNWGFRIGLFGGILLALFSIAGLASKQLFAKLAQQ